MSKIKQKRKKWNSVEVISGICISLLVILIVIPFWNALVISVESATEYAKHPFSWLPRAFNLENYSYLFKTGNRIILAYKNTILLTLFGTLIGMTVSVMTAYVFSRNFPGKRLAFRMMIFTMFFGGGVVPVYLLIRDLKLLETWTAVILLSLASAYDIIIMKNGFEAVPSDLQDAAMIDGANDMRIFVSVMLPLQKPLIATFSLFMAVGYWNSWYWQTILFNKGDKVVLQMYLKSLIDNVANEMLFKGRPTSVARINTYAEGVKMSAVFMVMLPIMCVYPFLQKYFVKGVLVGAVKM